MHAQVNQTVPTVAACDSLLMGSELDRVFRDLSMDAHEDTGSVEAPTGHVTKMTLTTAELNLERTREGAVENIDLVAPGHYIVIVNNSGIVWAFAFNTQDDRDKAYEDLDNQYCEWLGPEVTDLDDAPSMGFQP